MSDDIRCTYRIALPTVETGPCVYTAARTDHYPVHVCETERTTVSLLTEAIDGRSAALITDDTVAELHADRLVGMLRARGIAVTVMSVPPGERSKSLGTVLDAFDWLAGSQIARRDVLVAVGGGVVIDTAGWIASAYMRGVPYINVPTTLLAAVDAGLGGKVAVDHPSAKNLIGAFHQPKAVITNIGYLTTLDARQISAGMAEVIKKGVIGSPELFALIEEVAEDAQRNDVAALGRIVRGASLVKRELLAHDPYECDLRRPLNFGHTVGHAVETVTGYGPVLHGEAVACGMAVAARISARRGLINAGMHGRLVRLLSRLNLPSGLAELPVPVDPADVVGALEQIRKIRDGRIRFVLPTDLGDTMIADDVTGEEVYKALLAVTGSDAPPTSIPPLR